MENKLQIFIDGYEIIETGSVAIHSSSITFKIRGLTYVLEFQDDSVNSDRKFRAENLVEDPKGLKLILINFNDSLGVGNIGSPMHMGTTAGKDLFLSLRVYSLSGSNKNERTIHYTWMLKM